MKGLALVTVLLAARAVAAPIIVSDDETHWQLDLPEGWEAFEPPLPPTGKLLAAYASGARRLVVARVRGNTDGAYDGRPGFFAGLEDGVAREVAGYARLSSGARKVGKKRLPTYDLWYRSEGGVRGIRFVFLHGYTIILTLDIPGQHSVSRDARRLLESFSSG